MSTEALAWLRATAEFDGCNRALPLAFHLINQADLWRDVLAARSCSLSIIFICEPHRSEKRYVTAFDLSTGRRSTRARSDLRTNVCTLWTSQSQPL